MTQRPTTSTSDIVIVSTWGRTTKAMTERIMRLRKRLRGDEFDAPFRRLYALEEVHSRCYECGEILNREMVAQVCRYYGANADELWGTIIEAHGGPDQVSPEFQINPMFLDPRIAK
jgi:hypothetical protein